MKKLKSGHFLMMLVILAGFFTACNKDEDIKLDFDITVPDNWKFYVLANSGNVYEASRNPVNEQDTVVEYLFIFKQPAQGYDLQAYFNAYRTQILASKYYVSTMQEKDTAINGTNFTRLITRETEPYLISSNDTVDMNRILTRYFFFENNNGYYLVMGSIDTIYYRNKPVFDAIMSSFHFKY